MSKHPGFHTCALIAHCGVLPMRGDTNSNIKVPFYSIFIPSYFRHEKDAHFSYCILCLISTEPFSSQTPLVSYSILYHWTFAQRKGHPGCCITGNPKEKPLPNLTEEGSKALQNSQWFLPGQATPTLSHPPELGRGDKGSPSSQAVSESTEVHPGQHLETT